MRVLRDNQLFRLLASVFFVFTISAFFLFSRIQNTPNPSDAERMQHHRGDGATELGVLAAHQYWQKFGYAASYFLPCTNTWSEEKAIAKSDCIPYTHYPPGMYLLSSSLLRFFSFQTKGSIEYSLIYTRWALLLISSLVLAIAFAMIANAFRTSFLQVVLLEFLFILSKGYQIFSDNLFGHGIVLAYQGVIFSFFLLPIKNKFQQLLLYGGIAFLGSWLSVEILPVLFLAPAILFFVDAKSGDLKMNCCFSVQNRKTAMQFFLVALLAFLFCVFLRSLQNAMWMGSLQAVWRDWILILQYRLGASSHGIMETVQTVPVEWSISFWKHYLWEILRYQRIMISSYGQIFIGVIFLVLLLQKKWPTILFLLFFGMITNSWNLVFIQHSLIHLYTTRYIVWTFFFSALFFTQQITFFSRRGL